MKNIIIVVGSARKGRVADKVLQYVQDDLSGRKNIKSTVVDLAEANLPFFNNEHSPSDDNFSESNENVAAWTKQVGEADAVILLTAEYNHSLPAIQKNAIDWIYKEWVEKPVVSIAYGWYGGAHSLVQLREMAPVVKMDLKPTPAQLYFTKDIDTSGELLDEGNVRKSIATAISKIA